MELKMQRALTSEPWIIRGNISGGLSLLQPAVVTGGMALWHSVVAWRQSVSQSCFIASNFFRTETWHLLYVSSEYTRNASQIAKLDGPAYPILNAEYSEPGLL